MRWLSEVVEPVNGITPERWDVLLVCMAVVLFAAGFLVAERL